MWQTGIAQNMIPDSSFTSETRYWHTYNGHQAQFFATPYQLDTGFNWIHRKMISIDTCHPDFVFLRLVQFENGPGHITSDVIYTKLTQLLVKDSVYTISLLIYPADFISVPYAQVHFSKKLVSQPERLLNEKRSDLYLPDSSAITNKVLSIKKTKDNEVGYYWSHHVFTFEDKWLRISGKYKAEGGETFIYIGNIAPCHYTAYSSKVFIHKRRKCRKNNPERSPVTGFIFLLDDFVVRKNETLLAK